MSDKIRVEEGQQGLDTIAKGYTFNAYAIAAVLKEDYIAFKAAHSDQTAESIEKDLDNRIQEKIKEVMDELGKIFSPEE